jgi:hypothetical protein
VGRRGAREARGQAHDHDDDFDGLADDYIHAANHDNDVSRRRWRNWFLTASFESASLR